MIVPLGPRAYPVLVSARGAELVARALARAEAPLCVVTDANVRRAVWPAIAAEMRRRRSVPPEPLVVPAGERSKSWSALARLQAAMLRQGFDRSACAVALGGGVVLDLAGLAAATYMRGIDWIAVPTTLLAMVDAAVGGKVAIDLAGAKNVVGAFHQPRAVLVGTDFLSTLPRRERRSGLAEVVKTAMIADRRLWLALEREPGAWQRPRPALDVRLVLRCCRVKARIVAADERDRGARAVLNFGHTLGHAIEGDGRHGLLHGEAVGLGMLVACTIAETSGVAREPQVERLRRLLLGLGLPVTWRRAPRFRALRHAWRRDKKARGGAPKFVLTPRIGAGSVGHRVPEEHIVQALRAIFEPRLATRP